MSNAKIFEDYFANESSGILKWVEPIKIGLDIIELKFDKRDNEYFVVDAYFPDGERKRMNTYPFTSMVTQLEKLFGSIDMAVGHQILVDYHGKKPVPDNPSKSFHSGFITDINPQ